MLRLRRVRACAVLTYKGPSFAGRHKSREEFEVEISDFETFQQILRHLGFTPVFRYEKYRAEYQNEDRSGIVTLDETILGTFFELEGTPAWIDRTARQLGFSEIDYITDSYGRLYLDFHSRNPTAARDMTFPRRFGRTTAQ